MAESLKILVIEDNEDDFILLQDQIGRLKEFDAEMIHHDQAHGAVDKIREVEPTLVMLDFRLGDADGIEVLKEIRSGGLLMPVIVLTGFGDPYIAAEITRAGADDYVVKDDLESDRLPAALAAAIAKAGKHSLTQTERSDTLEKLQTLTPREAEVLDQIVAGLTNKQIAEKLFRSVETIKVHRAHIMSKIKADSTADLVRRVMTARLG